MTNNNRIFDVLLLLLGWLFIYVDASFVVCVVRRVRRSSFRLSRLVYRLLQFQERVFSKTKNQRQRNAHNNFNGFSFFFFDFHFFFVGWSHCGCPFSLSFPKKTLNHTHTHIFFSCVFFLLLFRSLFSLLINEREGKNGNRRRTADQRRRRKQKGWRITRHRFCPGR